MAVNWLEYGGERHKAWNIPQTAFTKLETAATAAKNANSVPTGAQNAITNTTLKAAFVELASSVINYLQIAF